MPERLLFLDFRDELGNTRYPFADGASLRSKSGHALDIGMFIDASIYPIGAGSNVYISAINVGSAEVTFTLADETHPALATATFNPLDPPETLLFTDDFGRPAGLLLTKPAALAAITTWPVMLHQFAPGTTEFVSSCVVPTPEIGVRGFLLPDGEFVAGDVWFVGTNGVVVRDDGGAIRIDIVGDPLFVRTQCTPVNLFQTPNFLLTVNGCGPDEHGNISLTIGDHMNAQTILRLYPVNGGLQIDAVGQ